jgi:cbb3-type cytochrome oxidase subunit 3
MQIYSLLASMFTVISFAVFAAIVLWAYSERRKPAFDAAANEPFALPDERDCAQRCNPYEARR